MKIVFGMDLIVEIASKVATYKTNEGCTTWLSMAGSIVTHVPLEEPDVIKLVQSLIRVYPLVSEILRDHDVGKLLHAFESRYGQNKVIVGQMRAILLSMDQKR